MIKRIIEVGIVVLLVICFLTTIVTAENSWYSESELFGDKCIQEDGKFYLIQGQDVREVACCRDYCDKMSTPEKSYYCDYDKGCVEVTMLKECPSGYCCIEGGQWKVQNCLPGKECCIKDTTDPYSGPCKDKCGGKTTPSTPIKGYDAIIALITTTVLLSFTRRRSNKNDTRRR